MSLEITLYNADCQDILRGVDSESINCVVTSPPYWGLRNYQVDGQIGLEKTPEEYVGKLVEIFREVRRVLKPQGTLWLNLGDSYNGSQKGSGGIGELSTKQNSNKGANFAVGGIGIKVDVSDLKPKDLCGIPWRVALALQADGWWLRQDIIWAKPNPMPESVIDRCTKSHEYIFLLTKSAKYYYDHESIKEDSVDPESHEGRRFRGRVAIYDAGAIPDGRGNTIHSGGNQILGKKYEKRNKRSVWTVNVQANGSDIHFATFSEDLIRPCLLAGCPAGGVVMDCFMGTGTVGVLAKKLRLSFVGIELNKAFFELSKQNIDQTECGLF